MAEHDPLDEDPYDPLDERAVEPDMGFVRGGSHEDGFSLTVAEARDRAGRLAHSPTTLGPKVTQRRKRAFLRALAQSGNVSLSCAAAGWRPDLARAARKQDASFSEAWDLALETAADLLEAEAFRRAVHGVQKAVWHKPKEGAPEVIDYETVYSDQLMQTLLKGAKPEKFRERHEVQHDASSKGGVLLVPAAVPLDQWEAAAAAQQAKYREQQEPDQP